MTRRLTLDLRHEVVVVVEYWHKCLFRFGLLLKMVNLELLAFQRESRPRDCRFWETSVTMSRMVVGEYFLGPRVCRSVLVVPNTHRKASVSIASPYSIALEEQPPYSYSCQCSRYSPPL